MENPSKKIKRLLGQPTSLQDIELIYNIAKLRVSVKTYMSYEQVYRLQRVQAKTCYKSFQSGKLDLLVKIIGFPPQSKNFVGLWTLASDEYTFWGIQMAGIKFVLSTSLSVDWSERLNDSFNVLILPQSGATLDKLQFDSIIDYVDAIFSKL